MQFIRGVYGLFLSLFPRNYREEYGEELQAVFRLSIEDALDKGTFGTADVILRELIDLPNWIRPWAYSTAASSAPWAMPRAWAATPGRE